MLAQELSISPTVIPKLQEVTERDVLFAELCALPDATSRRRRRRIAKKVNKRLDFSTYTAFRRAEEIHKLLEELPD